MPQRVRFTRLHHRIVADTLKASRPTKPSQIPDANAYEKNLKVGYWDQWASSVDWFVNMFKSDNPNFDRERFLTWCYE